MASTKVNCVEGEDLQELIQDMKNTAESARKVTTLPFSPLPVRAPVGNCEAPVVKPIGFVSEVLMTPETKEEFDKTWYGIDQISGQSIEKQP
jgi:hypothetical protein